jgi:hypothetical protein
MYYIYFRLYWVRSALLVLTLQMHHFIYLFMAHLMTLSVANKMING